MLTLIALLCYGVWGLLIPVQEGTNFCMSDDYAMHTLVQGSYKFEVHKNETNRRPVGVTVVIINPVGMEELRSEQKPIGQFSFTSSRAGEYQICLNTNSSFFTSKRTLYLTINIATGSGNKIEEREENEAPEKFLHRLEQKMHQIQMEQDYYMERHAELLHTESSNAHRIILFNVIQILVVLGFGYLQLRQFVKFLKLRKII